MEEPETAARPYQLELLESALEENTIVNLGTGAGKTYIAVMMIRELSPSIFHQDKRSVFLVTTVSLVKQQAEYIALHTRLEVGQYIGEKGVDGWPKEKWKKELASHHVLVMTMTIFKNLILANHMQFSGINLLVFDECHHAVKNHDYVQIMRRYNDWCLKDPSHEDDPTRILGLTASLIPSKCRPGDLERKIEELEKTLCCRSQTAEDLREVAKYATNPDESKLFYSAAQEGDQGVLTLKNILEDPLNFLELCGKERKKSPLYGVVKLYLDDCLHILLNLGAWCAHRFAVSGLDDITEKIEECHGYYDNDWEEHLLQLASTHLRMFVKGSKEVLASRGCEFHMVDKVRVLLRQLGDSAVCSGELSPHRARSRASGDAGKLVGIIFTERRTTAALLCQLLEHTSRLDHDLRHIKCDYVVGHDSKGSSTYLRKEARMSSKKQEQVLEKFRKNAINLLVATSVVEEGMDIRKCNTVIRFDFPQNFRSYVQSKGRARAKKSKYVLLIPKEERAKLELDLRDYNSLVGELERVCHNRHAQDSYEHLMELVPPHMNGYGAAVTINSSLSLVHRYCQILPKDKYTTLTADFSAEKREITRFTEENPYRVSGQVLEYRCTLALPMSSPIKEQITGDWFPTRRLAEKSAALETVKRLDQQGELDQHLKPLAKGTADSDSEEEEEEAGFCGVGEGIRVEEETRKRRYLNIVAPTLTGCFPETGAQGNCLYMFYISDATSGGLYLSQAGEEQVQFSFGILSSKSLPHFQIPEFSVYDDERELHVKICKYHTTITLTPDELELLKNAHFALFNEVLKIRPPWLRCCFETSEKNYLVVPLRFMPFLANLEAFIDFDMARQMATLKSAAVGAGPLRSEDHVKPAPWPAPLDCFKDTIVTQNYAGATGTLHEVREVSADVNLSSPVSFDAPYATFREYFSAKYNCTFTDATQPALVCKQLGESGARLQLLTSRYKSHDGVGVEKGKNRGRTVELFPEVCNLYPLPASCWKLAHCVPSILWRVECILAVDPLRQKITAETGVGESPVDGAEFTTCVELNGYKDVAFGHLNSQKLMWNESNGEPEMFAANSYDPLLELPHRGPNNVLLLQALTPKGASDAIDLERLETLGDSFLKFSTTVFLYFDHSTMHEGKLSMARSRRVSNLNLFRLAKRHRLTNMIFSSAFNPRQMWTPPCFAFDNKDPNLTPLSTPCSRSDDKSGGSLAPVSDAPGGASPLSAHPGQQNEDARRPKSKEEVHYLYHKLTDKGIADSVESLIGAYLVAGGISAGIKFMMWLGIKIKTESLDDMQLGEEDLSPSGDSDLEEEEEDLEEGEIRSPVPIPCAIKKLKLDPSQLPVFVQNSASILSKFFHSRVESFAEQTLDGKEAVELKRLLSISSGKEDVQDVLGWTFNDRTLLLQAVTHASYTKNRLTQCYQRLEFLGDAVLDYLVTCHIYSTFPDYGPGKITGMRSALVNNFTFAELTVQLRLHTALLYNSPGLYKQIDRYIQSASSCDQESANELIIDANSSELASNGAPSPCEGQEEGAEEEDEEVEYLDPPKVLGDILESLAGAIFIDSGMSLEAVWKVFKPHFDKKIASFNGKIPIGPIQELYNLEADVKTEKTTESKKVRYKITVSHNGSSVSVVAIATSFKAAKTAAARAVLKKINRT